MSKVSVYKCDACNNIFQDESKIVGVHPQIGFLPGSSFDLGDPANFNKHICTECYDEHVTKPLQHFPVSEREQKRIELSYILKKKALMNGVQDAIDKSKKRFKTKMV